MNPRRKWTMVLIAACLLLAAAQAKEIPSVKPEEVGVSSAKLAQMQTAAQKMVDEEKIAGIITLIARHGKVCYFETDGHQDREAGKLMQRDTIFRIYSMSKPITSVAAMILCEQGKVLLDEPVENYIPEFRGLRVYAEPEPAPTKRKVTVRDLMRHTSGFTYGIFGNTPVDQMYLREGVLGSHDLKEMVGKLAGIPLLNQPGTQWHYSVSTDVLGHLVERVSGQTLDVFFAENIFQPLDMKDTGFYVPQAKHARFSQCYGPNPEGGLKPTGELGADGYLRPRTFFSGGGGLVSTARDYLRFCQMLLNQGKLGDVRILEPETVAMMTRDQLPSGVSVGDGVGFAWASRSSANPIRTARCASASMAGPAPPAPSSVSRLRTIRS